MVSCSKYLTWCLWCVLWGKRCLKANVYEVSLEGWKGEGRHTNYKKKKQQNLRRCPDLWLYLLEKNLCFVKKVATDGKQLQLSSFWNWKPVPSVQTGSEPGPTGIFYQLLPPCSRALHRAYVSTHHGRAGVMVWYLRSWATFQKGGVSSVSYSAKGF